MGMKRSRLVLSQDELMRARKRVRSRDKGRCRCCGIRSGLHVHHIVYRSQGGDDAEWNLITLCHHCHDSIHKPHPRTGAMLIIMPNEEGQPIDANGPVKFFFANGWLPRRKVA
jgi:hypothetical protein